MTFDTIYLLYMLVLENYFSIMFLDNYIICSCAPTHDGDVNPRTKLSQKYTSKT